MQKTTTVAVKMNLNVTQEEFFTILNNSLLADIRRFSTAEIKDTEIRPGYSYHKTYAGGKNLEVTIQKLARPVDYRVRMSGDGHTVVSSYHMIKAASGTDVTYTESTDDKTPDLTAGQRWLKEH